jgi:hypothetical protein
MREHKDDIVYFGHSYDARTAVLLDGSVLPELERLYGAAPGSLKLGSVVTALKKLGMDKIYDAAEAESSAAAAAAAQARPPPQKDARHPHQRPRGQDLPGKEFCRAQGRLRVL